MRSLALRLTLLSAILVSYSVACAAGPTEKSEGFSGRISVGAGYMASTDQLKTTDENKRIDSLSGDADRYDKIIPLALFNLRYTFAESGRQVYIGTPEELSGPPGLSLGFVQPFSDGSRLDVSVLTRCDLFGTDYLFATLMAGYRYRDANIGFLDAQTFMSGALIGVEF